MTLSQAAREAPKTAVVAGGTSGIGLEIAERLLREGFRVGLFGSRPGKAEVARQQFSTYADTACLSMAVDIRDEEAINGFFEEIQARWGGVSALIVSAGISPKRDGGRVPVHEIDLAEWMNVMSVNLTGAFLSCRSVLPGMVERRYGRIVLIGSMAARTAPRFAGAAYVASKAGLSGLARSIAAEYGALGITANTVAPGNIATPMTGAVDSPQNAAAVARIPVGRIGLPDDVAGVTAFLCSEESGFINGATVDVTGGEFMTA